MRHMVHMVESSPEPTVDRGITPPPGRFVPGRIEAWEPAPVPIDPWLVLRLCRYRRREMVAGAIWEAAEQMAARAGQLVQARGLTRTVRVTTAGPAGARLGEGPVFSGRAVGRLLQGCPLAVAFLLTLGPRLEAEVAALTARRDLLEAFLLDTAGWAAIETAARGLRRDLAARARGAGLVLSARLAPGYLDWPLEEQPALVGLFGGGAGLVRLSEQGVLAPFKSLSGLFGLAPAATGTS